MNKVIFDNLDYLIDTLENDEYNNYYYNSNKFKIKHNKNEKKLDIEAKLGINNFYLKDNINNINYIFAKKYLNTEIQLIQVLIQENENKKYFYFLMKDKFISLVSCYYNKDNDMNIYENKLVLGNKKVDIIKYMNFISKAANYDEYLKKDNKEEFEQNIPYNFEEEIPEDIEEYIIDELEELEEYDIEEFEEEEEDDFSEELDINTLEENEDEDYNNYLCAQLQDYNNYNVIVNGQEIESKEEKRQIIPKFYLELEEIYADAMFLQEIMVNLKMVLDDKNVQIIEQQRQINVLTKEKEEQLDLEK